MKYITTLLSLIVLIGCSTTQSNIQVDSIETFNLDNYNDFDIKINTSNISAEINPIVLERFREELKGAISERGLDFNKESNLIFEINFTTKESVESDRMDYYLKDLEKERTVWTVVTVWRDGSKRSISSDDASAILVDEIMLSFL